MSETRSLDALLESVTVDAYGYDEQLCAFHAAFEDALALPVDAHLFGEPVTVRAIDFDGNERRGLTATCAKGRVEHEASLADVEFALGPPAALLDAYRRLLGLEPLPRAKGKTKAKRHKVEVEAVTVGAPQDFAVLAVKPTATRLRVPGTDRRITLRKALLAVPGEVARITPKKVWTFANHPYLSADGVPELRLEAQALGLTPLQLHPRPEWRPDEHYWGEPNEPLEDWARPIHDAGPRPQFELEQVVPREDPMPLEDGPILQAVELYQGGQREDAYDLLMDLLTEDLRCLDAHAHLGNFSFGEPHMAIRHFAVGVEIARLSLGPDFGDVLPWGCLDNRPFLRCLHGYGLCLWRLGLADEALDVFDWMLWLNPTDNQGARFLRADLRAGRAFEEDSGLF